MAGSGDHASCAGISGRDQASGRGDTRRPGITYRGIRAQLALGPGGPMRWFFSAIWLVYLIQPVAGLFEHDHTVAWIAGGLAITVAFCVAYVAVIGTWDRVSPQVALRGLGVVVVLAVLACVVYGSDWLALWIYVSAATGFVFPGRRPAMLAVLGVSACYLLLAWLTHATTGNFLVTWLPVVLIGWAMIGFRLQIMLTRELSQARETVAKLAANEERLRLARDMHDLTGQSLSLVTLKSELARKMLSRLPQTRERDAALSEVDDIGRVSRQTLHDIREAVSGYRRPTLAVEIITSRTALESAGIALDDDPGLTLQSGTFDADAEAALAWCLREAVTNVIRHSGAKNCRIRLTHQDGEMSLEVSDDGRGLGGRDGWLATGWAAGDGGRGGPAAASGSARPAGEEGQGGRAGPESEEIAVGGTGLRGMSERLAGIGGRLTFGQAGASRRGSRLVATVPETGAPVPGDGQRGAAVTRAAASAPQGSAPQGSAPQGSGPRGSAPQGSGPRGSAPQGSGPHGSGPSAARAGVQPR
jgi:two-component system, NarL family, sensor histidine kinase DesK